MRLPVFHVLIVFSFGIFKTIEAVPAPVRYAVAANRTGGVQSWALVSEESLSKKQDDRTRENVRSKFAILTTRPKDNCGVVNGIRTLNCPTANFDDVTESRCIASDQLCNGVPDCLGAEDEDPSLCMFQLANQEQLHQLRKIIVQQAEMLENLASKSGLRQQGQLDASLMPSRPASFPFRRVRFRNA